MQQHEDNFGSVNSPGVLAVRRDLGHDLRHVRRHRDKQYQGSQRRLLPRQHSHLHESREYFSVFQARYKTYSQKKICPHEISRARKKLESDMISHFKALVRRTVGKYQKGKHLYLSFSLLALSESNAVLMEKWF